MTPLQEEIARRRAALAERAAMARGDGAPDQSAALGMPDQEIAESPDGGPEHPDAASAPDRDAESEAWDEAWRSVDPSNFPKADLVSAQARWDALREEERGKYADCVGADLRIDHPKVHRVALVMLPMPDTKKLLRDASELISLCRAKGDALAHHLKAYVLKLIYALNKGDYTGPDYLRKRQLKRPLERPGWVCHPKDDPTFWEMCEGTVTACERFFETWGLIRVRNTLVQGHKDGDKWRGPNVVTFPRFNIAEFKREHLGPADEESAGSAPDEGDAPVKRRAPRVAAVNRFALLLVRIAGTAAEELFGLVARNHGLNVGRSPRPVPT